MLRWRGGDHSVVSEVLKLKTKDFSYKVNRIFVLCLTNPKLLKKTNETQAVNM